MSTESEVEPEIDATTGSQPETVAGDLGAAIADMPEYEQFVETKAAVERNPEAQQKVQEFERLRDQFVQARQTGEATQDDLETLQNAQQELHKVPEMAEFLQAQDELDARLERLNQEITADLDIDFGDRIGGCCND
ncbi:YlbF family regulator [Halococcus qingdaonensis]|uniref:YlbF family regulator n=1 Tax=Halococcus qingdaonensis TaxID=224402 RepID=UPI00211600E4|nr:YlbF family regulator [Halococcus qingdaonensis]